MNLQDLNKLDINDVGEWPGAVKAAIILLFCVLVGVGWYFMDTKDQYIALERVQREERDLRISFEEKQAKAANYERYKLQLEEMRRTFGGMLRQLPNRKEVADLLVDVSQTGLAAGLEFELFQPQSEVPKDFYAELPIKLRVTGDYHQFGEFISGLAALPRIVTIHDIDIKPVQRQGGPAKGTPRGGSLMMEAVAKTYRYLDEGGGK